MSLSVAIRSFNGESRFEKVLQSLNGLADEIVIVDSGSTDDTCEIAKRYNAKIVIHQWEGFIAQANFAFDLCEKEWIFLLDQDEVVTEELKINILSELENPRFNGYEVCRQSVYLGRRLKHIWYPDWVIRIGKKSANARCVGNEPHEVMAIDGAIGKIKGNLDHYSYANLNEHFTKLISYSQIGAKSYFKRGKRASLLSLLFRPIWGFFKAYLLKRGFLDGAAGLIAAFSSSIHIFLKYATLYELNMKEKG
ncbi:MAG: glycosyltransferase family 2 protein [Helicobacteraceae bacterium]|nr:glycosyltransferase family 2 protein [Helicobacteraceae bacterium]